MVYPYATLSDTTEVVHSELGQDGRVKVYIEKAVYDGFHSATCYLPDYTWENIDGFSDDEMNLVVISFSFGQMKISRLNPFILERSDITVKK
jgi:hypothetical protein